MGAHRQQAGRRVAERYRGARVAERRRRTGKRAAAVRPRYDRIGAAGFSLVITAVALLAGVGIIPIGSTSTPAAADREIRPAAAAQQVTATPSKPAVQPATDVAAASEEAVLPPDSGTGKRVVFSISDQRIWLVRQSGEVLATHLASGSLTDNLRPGTYAVYSRSRHAIGIDDSGTMEYFVRFTRGENAAIGFHSIPEKDGEPLQTVAELGTPTSHGCIRQELGNAKRLWDFAPVGTTVVVTA